MSSQSRLSRSDLMDLVMQSRHVLTSWVHSLVTATAGKSVTGLTSVQMMQVRSPVKRSVTFLSPVMTTVDASGATLYRWPNLR
jgi:hypothetical protein